MVPAEFYEKCTIRFRSRRGAVSDPWNKKEP